jgi:myosin-9
MFLRGELTAEIVPDFCDVSVFKTIVNRARRAPTKTREERQTAILQTVKELTGKKPISNKPTSVGRQFEFSLNRLMKTLSLSTPYFIRCIKSNNEKISDHFDDNIILRQLRYTGMLETVRIRRAGYSIRIQYAAFVDQYKILLPNGRNSTREDVEIFFNQHPLIEKDSIQFGKTKIFLRESEKLLLDDHLHRVCLKMRLIIINF